MFYLYQIENLINGKKYIGITNDPDYRKYQHFNGYGSQLVFRAIKKYGRKNLQFIILRQDENEDFIKWLEIEKIKEYKTLRPGGYNLTQGGEGTYGYLHSKENRQKMSKLAKKRYHSQGVKQQLIESHKGKKHSARTKQKISQKLQGRFVSKKTRQKMSKSSQKARRLNPYINARPVLVKNVSYKSIKDAALALNYTAKYLSKKFCKWKKSGIFPDGYKYL